MQRNKAFNGIKILEVVKSRKSNIVFPQILKFSKSPKDRVAGIDIKETIKKSSVQAFTREIFNLSTIEAIGTSIILIPEVTAAASRRTKNEAETRFPCGIWAKI